MGRDNVSSNDIHRLFLQAIQSRRTLSEKLAKLLWKQCVQAVKTVNPDLEFDAGTWEEFEAKITEVLNPYDLEFKAAKDELTGKKIYTFINVTGDDVAQMATDYTPIEIAFFKGVVEQIVLAPNLTYSVSSLAALREVSHLKGGNMTKSQAEMVLESFVARGWLLRSRRGRYSLGSRSILELNRYLKETYDEDLVDCTLCTEFVTKGIRCGTPNCKTYMHNHCHNHYRRSRQVCPSCQQAWDKDGPGIRIIGEEAAKEGQDERRKSRRRESDEEDVDDSMYADNTQTQDSLHTQSQSRSQTQSRTQPKKEKKSNTRRSSRNTQSKSKKAIESDEEEEEVATDKEEEEEEDHDDEEEDAMDIDNLPETQAPEPKKSTRRRK